MSVNLVSHSVNAVGNTETSTARVYQQSNVKRHYSFTWNNYEKVSVSEFIEKMKKECISFVIQEEIGKEGTPHLQGSIHLKGRGLRITQLKKIFNDKIHWEETRNIKASDAYCMKNDTASGQRWIYPEPEPELKCIEKLYPWQTTIEKKCQEPVDDRAVHWVYDNKGNIGKSAFARYMVIKKQNVIVITGGALKDIANAIKNTIDSGNLLRKMSIFIFDIDRAKHGKISYSALEQIKNGLITNTKYESGTLTFNPPHLWVFSNNLPDYDKMSKDRWHTYIINENKELVNYVIEDIESSNSLDDF